MIHLKNTPIGIDEKIQLIQKAIYNTIGWTDIEVYGRVNKNTKDGKKIYPEYYIGNGEYKEVLTDDTKQCTVFFIDRGNHKTKEGIRFEATVSVVFIVNLKKLQTEDIKAEQIALKAVQKINLFEIEELNKGIKESLKDFYTEGIKFSDMYPYHVFAIEGKINYQINSNCF